MKEQKVCFPIKALWFGNMWDGEGFPRESHRVIGCSRTHWLPTLWSFALLTASWLNLRMKFSFKIIYLAFAEVRFVNSSVGNEL